MVDVYRLSPTCTSVMHAGNTTNSVYYVMLTPPVVPVNVWPNLPPPPSHIFPPGKLWNFACTKRNILVANGIKSIACSLWSTVNLSWPSEKTLSLEFKSTQWPNGKAVPCNAMTFLKFSSFINIGVFFRIFVYKACIGMKVVRNWILVKFPLSKGNFSV